MSLINIVLYLIVHRDFLEIHCIRLKHARNQFYFCFHKYIRYACKVLTCTLECLFFPALSVIVFIENHILVYVIIYACLGLLVCHIINCMSQNNGHEHLSISEILLRGMMYTRRITRKCGVSILWCTWLTQFGDNGDNPSGAKTGILWDN